MDGTTSTRTLTTPFPQAIFTAPTTLTLSKIPVVPTILTILIILTVLIPLKMLTRFDQFEYLMSPLGYLQLPSILTSFHNLMKNLRKRSLTLVGWIILHKGKEKTRHCGSRLNN